MDSNVGLISRPLSIALLLLFIAYIVYLIIDAKKNPTEDDDIDVQPLWKSVVLIIIGIMLIIGGGQAVVYAAKAIARTFGMTETLIGLTIVAVGTSLPELVTSIVAAKKGETGMAVGNVVGSNIFNMMFILGLSSLINPIDVNMASLWDLIILVIVSVIVYVFSGTKRNIGKREGAIMLLIYLADMVFAILR
jgi:cation:H+ antiporter